MSGSKRKNNGPSDFKRIRAKVGKKAQRQNDTDVSFQSASIRVGQSIQRDIQPKKSGNLKSTRGKDLFHLVSTASTHPAATVRVSSLRGVLDIIYNQPTDALIPNLSMLIPTCVHSCVDEDQDVRHVGLDALSSLLKKIQEEKARPFGTLLIARTSSALHSLDSSIRIHGVKMVTLMSTTCPSLTTSYVDRLLGPLSILLDDQRTKKAKDEILQSLVLVLRINTTRYTCTSAGTNHGVVEIKRKADHQPDLLYLSGGRSRNAILMDERSFHTLPSEIESISHLSYLEHSNPSFLDLQKRIEKRERRPNSRDERFDFKCKTVLLSKLRDCLIETINLEHEATLASNDRIARSQTPVPQRNMNYPRVILLLRCTRYLCKSFEMNIDMNEDKDRMEFDKVTKQIISVLMDIFPIDQDLSAKSSDEDNKSISIIHVNAVIATSILDISQINLRRKETVENDTRKKWMKMICSYVIPRISHLQGDNTITTSEDLDMTCRFLRFLGKNSVYSDELESVIGTIQNLYFINKNTQLARSIVGRKISVVIMDLIELTNFSLSDESPISKAFLQFLMMIPFYLEVWAIDYMYESRRLLEGLHKLIREFKGICSNPLVESIRHNWYKLVLDRGNSKSILEMYPLSLRKVCLDLMVLVGRPSDQSLKDLASICYRSTLNTKAIVKREATSQAIIEAIQKVRRTIPMQRYLIFLLQSAGVPHHVKGMLQFETVAADKNLNSCSKTVFEESFFLSDPALNRVARALVEPRSTQVLRMISPQLSSWQNVEWVEGGSPVEFLFKTRASYIILAYFLLNEADQEKKFDDVLSLFENTNGAMTLSTLTHSICKFVNCVACSEHAMAFQVKLTSPIVAIMSSENTIWNAVIREICDSFQKAEMSETKKKNIVSMVIDWMKDPRLRDANIALSSPRLKIEQLLSDSGEPFQERWNFHNDFAQVTK